MRRGELNVPRLNRHEPNLGVRDPEMWRFSGGAEGAGAPQSRVSDEDRWSGRSTREHAGPLLRYALHLTSGDRQRAEDIVQETLLRAWLHPEAIAEPPGPAVAVRRRAQPRRRRATGPGRPGRTRWARPPWTLMPVPDEADRALESWAVADALRVAAPRPPRGVCSRPTTAAAQWPRPPPCSAFPRAPSSHAPSTRSGAEAGTGGTGACAMSELAWQDLP